MQSLMVVEGVESITSEAFRMLIRHNLGKNCSYFWNKMFTKFFALLQNSIEFKIEYDESTISIRLKESKSGWFSDPVRDFKKLTILSLQTR